MFLPTSYSITVRGVVPIEAVHHNCNQHCVAHCYQHQKGYNCHIYEELRCRHHFITRVIFNLILRFLEHHTTR